ncbi:MAG: sulfotransferase [Clostridia bacterium]|nr:sulfotransferase [Deltaproteobacteria bacterium]
MTHVKLDRPIFLLGASFSGAPFIRDLLAKADEVRHGTCELRLIGARDADLLALLAGHPEARFVFVFRDPPTQVRRLAKVRHLTAATAAKRWASATGRILDGLSALPETRWVSVSYEAFLTTPTRESLELAASLGLTLTRKPERTRVQLARATARRAELHASQVDDVMAGIADVVARASATHRSRHSALMQRPSLQQSGALPALVAKAGRAMTTARIAAGLVGGYLAVPATARAATFNVTTNAPNGDGSLASAIAAANAAAGADIVEIASTVTGTIGLADTLQITESVEVRGPGANVLSLNGLVRMAPATDIMSVTLSGMTFDDNSYASYGAVRVDNTNLVIEDAAFRNNGGKSLFFDGTGGVNLSVRRTEFFNNYDSVSIRDLVGSAVFDDVTATANRGTIISSYNQTGNLTITDSDVRENFSQGDVTVASIDGVNVMPVPTVTIRNTVIADNINEDDVGVMRSRRVATTIESSTISGNIAGDFCSGINQYAGSLVISRSTIANNRARRSGAIVVYQSPLTIDQSTIVGNRSADGESSGGVNMTNAVGIVSSITNSVIAGSSPATLGDVFNTSYLSELTARTAAISVSFSLVQTADANPFTDGGGNLSATDPKLRELGNYGGPTETMPPQVGSPLVNAGDPAFATAGALDQRGLARVLDGRIDMGAVEVSAAGLDGDGCDDNNPCTVGDAIQAGACVPGQNVCPAQSASPDPAAPESGDNSEDDGCASTKPRGVLAALAGLVLLWRKRRGSVPLA